LNWFIPALAKSSVGSSCGTTGEEGKRVWARTEAKCERKVSRMREAGHSGRGAEDMGGNEVAAGLVAGKEWSR